MPDQWNHITAGEIAQATSAVLDCGEAGAVFKSLSTDSRSIGDGDLFVALTGDQFDGHDFVRDVLSKGAGGVIVEKMFFQSSRAEFLKAIHDEGRHVGEIKNLNPSIMVVENTLKALGDLAAWRRHGHHAKVVGITGSSGKTTAKEMTALLLGVNNRILKTRGNFNNLIGLPLTLLGLEKQHDMVVLEMGMNRPGEISRLTEIAAPDVGVILNVGMAHLEGLHSLEGIAAAKLELMEGIRPEALMVLNGDDELLMKKAGAISRKSLTFGFGGRNDVRARNIEACGLKGTRFEMEYDGKSWPAELKVPGAHNVMNALAAAAVGMALGEQPEEIVAGLSRFEGIKGRFGMVQLKGNILLIDDTYNANPSSLKAAMETVGALRTGGGRLIVGLGDMLELGDAAARSHRYAGEIVVKAGAVYLLAMGEHAREMQQGAIGAGMPLEHIEVVQHHGEMAEKIMEEMKDRDTVFLKGSRRIGLEKVSEEIKRRHSFNSEPDLLQKF